MNIEDVRSVTRMYEKSGVKSIAVEGYAKAAGMPIAFRHGMRATVILSFGLQCIL